MWLQTTSKWNSKLRFLDRSLYVLFGPTSMFYLLLKTTIGQRELKAFLIWPISNFMTLEREFHFQPIIPREKTKIPFKNLTSQDYTL